MPASAQGETAQHHRRADVGIGPYGEVVERLS